VEADFEAAQTPTVKAVAFDLWDTLVEWPVDEAELLRVRVASVVDADPEEFERRWRDGYRASMTGPLADHYRALGVPEQHVEEQVAARHDFGRRVLRPREGALETLRELRRRDLRVGLITNCSEEVPAAWAETELAGLFDAETFSSACRLAKPEPEIYLHTAERLGVPPEQCLFVGDGANDELAGAERAGMTPVLFVPAGEEPPWPQVREWAGRRVSSIPEVLELC
jgi:putative hydrolase of the HAD superfamily